jgi:hypothetical protein
MDSSSLLKLISPPLDSVLASSLFAEFLDLERRFVLGDWEPATLNGGQFAEIAARIIYHIDSANLNRRKPFDDCMKYVEEDKGVLKHASPIGELRCICVRPCAPFTNSALKEGRYTSIQITRQTSLTRCSLSPRRGG